MTQAKHTPGPWCQDIHIRTLIAGGDGHNVADIEAKYHSVGENLANASLIAAAPELLEALELLVREFATHGDKAAQSAIKQARAAIAKAKGK